MASVTRSSRRAEGIPHHAGPPMRSRAATFNHAGPGGGGGGGGGGGRTTTMKRSLDASSRENEYEPIKSKKARIAVEILPPQKNQNQKSGKPRRSSTTSRAVPPPQPPSAAAKPTRAELPTTTATTTATTTNSRGPAQNNNNHNATSLDDDDQNLTKHQAKVINGIKHELDRLQPEGAQGGASSVTKEGGRKLRSQEATRFKSELSAYFPDYDEVIGNDPKEEHLLNIDTPIVVSDSSLLEAATGPSKISKRSKTTTTFPVRGYGDALYTDVVDAQRIDFSFLESQFKSKASEDPLPHSSFEPVHKRAERLERNIRNTEKGRAQHEKDQIVRLLEGLQGHDWLRIMGVSGITETKKKTFEPARQHFIQGCQGILDKFRNWNLEEKRRKLEKERALAEEADEDEEEVEEEEEAEEEEEDNEEDKTEETGSEDVSSLGESEASSPAKQLREEAMARSKLAAKMVKKPRPTARPPPLRPPAPPAPPKEFKSFFSKRYERDSAVNRSRRAGRKILAWGLPVPDFLEQDFDLPEEYRDEETLRVRARKKRRDKRGSKV